MKQIDHPQIIKLIDNFETEEDILLVLELAEGGNLYDKLFNHGSFP
jgi:calcium-dependent protein kinase